MRTIYAFVLVLICASTGCAQNQETTEQVYRDIAELRRQMVRMQKEVKAFVDEMVEPYGAPGATGAFRDVRVDITENENDMMVKADLPGMEKNKLDITLERGRTLKIAGTREYEQAAAAPGMVRQERSYGHFERVLELPAEGMPGGIKANYKDGVLDITIPKKRSSADDTVKIKVQ